MKGRFRILKTGVPLHGIEVTDRVWLTCCALHNFLLAEDELDNEWTAAEYLGFEGQHDAEDVARYLAARTDEETNLGQQMAFGAVAESERQDGDIPMEDDEEDDDGMGGDVNLDTRPLYEMSLDDFKQDLINNFDILYEGRKVCWPSRWKGHKPEGIEARMNDTTLN